MEHSSIQTASPPICTELELLLLCARKSLDDLQKDKLEQIVRRQLDWQYLLRLAAFHRLTPLLFHNLYNFAQSLIPQWVLEELRHTALAASARSLLLTAALHQIFALLKAHNIRALPFKGPVLAQAAYGNINLRIFTDLDILVAEQDALRARDLLVANGYKTEFLITAGMEEAFLREENFFALFNAEKNVSIDLHWELTGRYALAPLYLDNLTDTITQVKLAGRLIPTLSVEDAIVYLCIHSSSHCWEPLENISCISELIRNSEEIDWPEVFKRGTTLRSRRMLLLGLFLCHLLFTLELPAEIITEIRADKGLIKLGVEIFRQASHDPADQKPRKLSWRFSSIHIISRDSPLDRVRYLCRLLFRPTIKEWQTWPLPSSLTFLYYLYRPLRLGWEWVKKRSEE